MSVPLHPLKLASGIQKPKPPLQQTVLERPVTSKPRDPESYDFKDEQLAKDYRKMYEKYQQMEALMKQNEKSKEEPKEEESTKDSDED